VGELAATNRHYFHANPQPSRKMKEKLREMGATADSTDDYFMPAPMAMVYNEN